MELNSCTLGEHIEFLENTNNQLQFGINDVRGVNNLKRLIPTKADLNGRDLSKFQIVNPGDFVFNHRTSRNGSKFSIAYNDGDKPVICTEDYVVFRIKEESKTQLLAIWLYMFFNRSEFDRYVITNSWGSSTEFYNWEDICSVKLVLPPISVQQKYVDIYKAVLANQRSYERGVADLKVVIEGCVERARRELKESREHEYLLGELIEQRKEKYDGSIIPIKGVSRDGFIDPKQQDADLTLYNLFYLNDFVFNPARMELNSIALNLIFAKACCSSLYEIFYVSRQDIVMPEYLNLLLKRDEFARWCEYVGWGSAREYCRVDTISEYLIRIPSLEHQKQIVDLHRVLNLRIENSIELKTILSNLCPILIKGSIEEAQKEA